MDIKLMAELSTTAKKVCELCANNGIVSLDSTSGKQPRVHCTEKFFFDTFSEYSTKERGDGAYPFEYSTDYKGVRFFCIGEKRNDE